MSREEEILDTALQQSDDDPMMTEDGYTAITPEFNELDMLEALENSGLPLGEAKRYTEKMTPLSNDELEIIESTPGLSDLDWVDAPYHDRVLEKLSSKSKNAMDVFLEDQMYGEEAADRNNSDSDDIIRTPIRQPRPSNLVAPRDGDDVFRPRRLSAGKPAASKPRDGDDIYRNPHLSTAKPRSTEPQDADDIYRRMSKSSGDASPGQFKPARDAQKARLMKGLNRKLIVEHANFLQASDAKRGVKRPAKEYAILARHWAGNQIKAQGMPTSYQSGDRLAASIMGGDVSILGGWNPSLNSFAGNAKNLLAKTKSQRIPLTAAQVQGWGIKKAFRKAGRVAKRAGKVAKRGATVAVKTAIAPVKLASKLGKMTLAQLNVLAKAMARLAATPIRRVVAPTIHRTAQNLAGGPGKPVTSAHRKEASRRVLAEMSHGNPLVKMGVRVLKYVGTGISGDSSSMGMDPASIAAIAASCAAAIAVFLAARGPKIVQAAQQPGSAPMEASEDEMPAEEAYAEAAPQEAYPDGGYEEEAVSEGEDSRHL